LQLPILIRTLRIRQ